MISIKQATQILQSVESFIFKYTAIVTTQSTGGLSMMYSSFARRLSEAKSEGEINSVLSEIKSRLRENSPSFEVFKLSFQDLIYTKTKTKDRRLIKYILSKFYDDLNSHQVTDFEQMTIEHIHPQSKINKYKNPENLVGSLGNLLLISQKINSKLSNKNFIEKKNILAENGYNLD